MHNISHFTVMPGNVNKLYAGCSHMATGQTTVECPLLTSLQTRMNPSVFIKTLVKQNGQDWDKIQLLPE